MDSADVLGLVEDLGDSIDDLQESLALLVKTALSQSTSKLPLLDKAKLYVLVTYAIESILFSYLRLNGVDAKSHPVFQELARVKEYFGKIKAAETAGTKRSSVLDKEAANRFIKHGLAGNAKLDAEREDRVARERVGAKRKFDEIKVGTHTRFDTVAKKLKAEEAVQDGSSASEGESHVDIEAAGTSAATTDAEATPVDSPRRRAKAEKQAAKRQRRLERKLADVSMSNDPEGMTDSPHQSGADAETGVAAPVTSTDDLETLLQVDSPGESEHIPKKARKKRKSKSQKLEDDIANEMV